MLIRRTDAAGQNSVTIKLMGDDYVIRGEGTTDYLNEVARSVEARLEEVQSAHPKLAKTQLAMLVALKLADELQRLKLEHEEILRLLAEAR